MLSPIHSIGPGQQVVARYSASTVSTARRTCTAVRTARNTCTAVRHGLHADSSWSLRQRKFPFVGRPSRRTLQQPAVASATATWGTPAGFNDQPGIEEPSHEHAPLPLPPVPKSSNFMDVFPYLAKLALSEKTLYWRLATALGLMVLSKVAGISFYPTSSQHVPACASLPEHRIKNLGLGAMRLGHVCDGVSGLMAPVYFKHAVDAMGKSAVAATVAALLTSGLCRIVNGIAKEMQHPCFTPISQVSLCASNDVVITW